MSRIGKRPVEIPDKVNVEIKDRTVHVKGPKGQLHYTLTNAVSVEKSANAIEVKPVELTNESKAIWGMTRTLIRNMIEGVTNGFTKELEFTGVGYKAQVSGSKLVLNLGYSHPIEYQLPTGISAEVKGNVISVKGHDKELVGFVAAQIREFRPPEPYKGKGIKYINEVIIRKAGKTGAKK